MSIAAPQPIRPTSASVRGLTRRGLLKSGLGLTGVAGLVMPGTAAYAAAQAARDLVVTDYRPVPPRWPDAHRLSITVIADLHAGGPNMGLTRVREVVDAAQALNSDLVVILGDFFATHRFVTERVPHPVWAAELARLKAPLGVYAILGNHDWWYDIKACAAPWRRCASRCWKTTPCCWAIAAAASGWPGSATSSRTGSGPAASAASTICPARSRASPPTTRSFCWRTSRIFSPRCRSASP